MITRKIFKNTQEWEQYRQSRFWVGGSNIGIILGLSPYCSPRQYWNAHHNKQLNQPTAATERGRCMEGGIAKWFEKESGVKIIQNTNRILVYHNSQYPEYFQVAPDRETFALGEKKRGGVEIKDTLRHIDFDNPSTIPNEWYAQVQYNMGILERPFWWLVVCDGSKSLKFRKFAFDKPYFDELIKQATSWVENYIITPQIPPISTRADTLEAFPTSTEGIKETTQEVADIIAALKVAQKRAKEADEEVTRLQNIIAAEFDARDTLTFGGSILATFKTQSRKSVNIKALEADLGEEAQKYINNTIARTLRIK